MHEGVSGQQVPEERKEEERRRRRRVGAGEKAVGLEADTEL